MANIRTRLAAALIDFPAQKAVVVGFLTNRSSLNPNPAIAKMTPIYTEMQIGCVVTLFLMLLTQSDQSSIWGEKGFDALVYLTCASQLFLVFCGLRILRDKTLREAFTAMKLTDFSHKPLLFSLAVFLATSFKLGWLGVDWELFKLDVVSVPGPQPMFAYLIPVFTLLAALNVALNLLWQRWKTIESAPGLNWMQTPLKRSMLQMFALLLVFLAIQTVVFSHQFGSYNQ